MPAVSTSSKVLLTGGSGFIGAWILKDLLERGFHVRAAVRSEAKAAFLKDRFAEHAAKLEFIIVDDITSPGAFDEAVKGVNAIVHSASPLGGSDPLIDPAKLIDPAVQGTLGILKSAALTPSVERVVVTSSVTSVWDTSKKLPFVYTEDVWNENGPKIVEEKGKDAPLFLKYAVSKTLAERAAWDWIQQEKPGFDLVTILPSFTWGPIISETTADIKGSNARLLTLLKKANWETLKGDRLLVESSIVDVRDAAKLHVDALVFPVAGGQRFIASAKDITNQHIYNILNEARIEGLEVPRGEPALLDNWKIGAIFSSKRSEDVLGEEYRPIDETIRDTVVHALSIGWTQ